ncbi:hypothetical protein [Acaryochloris sp. IP29b_bin.137]|uniref:hypothetical protein n=1 Tax=Acaryochloris sp. IP29b_bin.137 TaxID=2969217 RepID=UPI0026374A3E|nr:hypothetical protein [Acaryochloris sp. IP29b_bin.137]
MNYLNRPIAIGSLLVFTAFLGLCEKSQAATINLSTWEVESYPFPPSVNDPASNWVLSNNGESVTQTTNGQQSFFYSDFDAWNTRISGKVIATGSDDDFIGFAFGFRPGDTTNSSANYLLLDWKQADQSGTLPNRPPGIPPGTISRRGLAVSRVTGIPVYEEIGGHVNYPEPSGSVQELERGNNFGDAGWVRNQEYTFDLIFNPNQLQVFVDGVPEIDINGDFNDGRFAFYNFSQAGVTYSAFDARPVPEASTLLGSVTVLGIFTFLRRARTVKGKAT